MNPEATQSHDDDDQAEGNMPNDLQIALLDYDSAKQHLLDVITATTSKQWQRTLRSLLNLPTCN